MKNVFSAEEKPGRALLLFLLISAVGHVVGYILLGSHLHTPATEYIELALQQTYHLNAVPPPPKPPKKISPRLPEIPTPAKIATIRQPERITPSAPAASKTLLPPDLDDLRPEYIIDYQPVKPLPAEPEKSGNTVLQQYFLAIKSRINGYKAYPQKARKRGLEGVTNVRFTLHRDGTITNISSSGNGHRLLERAARQSVRKASPFPPFPAEIDKHEITLTVLVRFSLADG